MVAVRFLVLLSSFCTCAVSITASSDLTEPKTGDGKGHQELDLQVDNNNISKTSDTKEDDDLVLQYFSPSSIRQGPVHLMVALIIWCLVMTSLTGLGMASLLDQENMFQVDRNRKLKADDYLDQYLKILADERHREACRDMAQMVAMADSFNYDGNYICVREMFLSNCMPFLHNNLQGVIARHFRTQTARGHNDYERDENLLQNYLKEKEEGMQGTFHGDQHVALNSKAVQDAFDTDVTKITYDVGKLPYTAVYGFT